MPRPSHACCVPAQRTAPGRLQSAGLSPNAYCTEVHHVDTKAREMFERDKRIARQMGIPASPNRIVLVDPSVLRSLMDNDEAGRYVGEGLQHLS